MALKAARRIMAITNSVSYTGDGSTTDYVVPFDFLYASDLAAYVDGEAAPFTVSGTTVTMDTAPGGGETLVIQRATDLEDRVVTFSDDAPFTAADLNAQVGQLLFGLQDVRVSMDNLGSGGGGGGGGGGDVPTPTSADRMLVTKPDGGGGFEYQLQTVGQLQTLLGISSPVTVPSPTSGNKFLITNAATNTYELATVEQIKTILSVPSFNLPALNGAPNRILVSNSSGTAVSWQESSHVRNLMGLGSAALLNTGTAVGNIPSLISHPSGPALPAIRGDNLLGVGKAQDYAMWDKNVTGGVGYEPFSGATSYTTLTAAQASGGGSASLTQTIDSDGTWDTSHTDGVLLSTGTYRIVAEVMAKGDASLRDIRLQFTSGTVSTNGVASPTGAAQALENGVAAFSSRVECVISVTSANAALAVQGRGFTPGANINLLRVRLHITKIA